VSENVYNQLAIGRQTGDFTDPGAAVAAGILFPISAPINLDLDRGSAFPKQDRGRNVRNTSGSGYHGIRIASTTLPWEVRFEDLPDILEMIYAGNVSPVSLGAGLYRWDYPFEVDAPTVVPCTLEAGNTDDANVQARLVSALISSLTLGFSNIIVPGAVPWTGSATVIAFDREFTALTDALVARGSQVAQGHLTHLYEGDTSEAFADLAELTGSLKSYTQTADRKTVGRAYGGSDDLATKFGMSDQSTTTFEMVLGVSADSKSDFHDVWNVSVPSPIAEKRIRLLCGGDSSRSIRIDARIAPLAVPFDEADGERLFKVTGEHVDDDALDASHQISVTNGVASLS
jgi:hypothetical protein